MTEIEFFEKCINVLGNIKVPCALADEVTKPIIFVRNGLIEYLEQRIKEEKEAQKESENNAEEPEITISEVKPITE